MTFGFELTFRGGFARLGRKKDWKPKELGKKEYMNKKIYKSITLVLLLAMLVSITGCFRYREKIYYSDKENFISATGTVTHMKSNDKAKKFFIAFSDLSARFEDNNFYISYEDLQLIRDDIWNLVHIGDSIEFVSAPKVFGDGYTLPIVSLTVNGEVLLDFETGWKNLMKNYR